MVGSGGGGITDRSKEAVGMMALHEALRNVCLNSSDWTYSVFWTIRPRPRIRGGNGCKVGDDNGSLMLMWEDGFCRGGRVGGGAAAEGLDHGMDGDQDAVRKAFSKMSIQLYNYGEGLMGKVASDKCHKWVFKEPTESEPNISNYWQSSFDALPTEWTDQFESGIQTIAVIQAGHGLLQLGSCKIIPEDLHFVLRMRHTFESLGYQSGFYLSQLFSSTRNASTSNNMVPPLNQQPAAHVQIRPPPPLFNWEQQMRPNFSSSMLTSPNYHQNSARHGLIPPSKDESTHMFMHPHSSSEDLHHHHQMNMGGGDHESDIKWPNGLSFFNALTGRSDEAKLLFNTEEGLENNIKGGDDPNSDMHNNGGTNPNEFLSLDSSHNPKMEEKFKRSFTLPARMATSSSSTSLDHHHAHNHNHNPNEEYRNESAEMYSHDVMETFVE